jgi:hypothetical protein
MIVNTEWEECRSGYSLIKRTVLAFSWRDEGKPRKTSVRIAGVLAKI